MKKLKLKLYNWLIKADYPDYKILYIIKGRKVIIKDEKGFKKEFIIPWKVFLV